LFSRPEPLRAAKSPQNAFLADRPSQSRSRENEIPHLNAAIPERGPPARKIFGDMERVTFRNDDSLICVLRKTDANRESRSSSFLISLVEAGVAK
jgi:hypothetical protein